MEKRDRQTEIEKRRKRQRQRQTEGERQRERLHLHLHLSLICGGRWGTTDDFTSSFRYFSPFSTALWDMAISWSVCLVFFPLSLSLCALQNGFGQT